jgi:hypothetical protein
VLFFQFLLSNIDLQNSISKHRFLLSKTCKIKIEKGVLGTLLQLLLAHSLMRLRVCSCVSQTSRCSKSFKTSTGYCAKHLLCRSMFRRVVMRVRLAQRQLRLLLLTLIPGMLKPAGTSGKNAKASQDQACGGSASSMKGRSPQSK